MPLSPIADSRRITELLIAESVEDVDMLLHRKTQDGKTIGLALHPQAQLAFSRHSIECINTNDVINNNDHKILAEGIVDLSKEWWRKAFGEIEEPEIDRLKITALYSYLFETHISRFLLNILSVINAIEKFNPTTCVLITKGDNAIFSLEEMLMMPSGFTDYIVNFPWQEMLKEQSVARNRDLNILFLNRHSKNIKKDHDLRNRSSHLFWQCLVRGKGYLFSVVKRRLKPREKKFIFQGDEEFVISNSEICLGALVEVLEKKHKVVFLSEEVIKRLMLNEGFDAEEGNIYQHNLEDIEADEFWNKRREEFEVNGVSCVRIVRKMVVFFSKQFPYLRKYYDFLMKDLARYAPRAYLTVSAAAPFDRLNVWAFHNSGVRAIWQADGLGQLNDEILKMLDSALWTDNPAEKWLISDNASKFFFDRKLDKGGLKVTGYLERNFEAGSKRLSNKSQWSLRKILKIPSRSKVVLYAATICENHPMRLFSDETYFELLQAIEEVVGAFAKDEDIFLIIKLHPRAKDSYLVKEITSRFRKVKIIVNIPIHLLIDISALVIVYHSSVGLETLYRGKHLIVYNTIGRPSYLTGIIDGLNHDPLKGAAARIVRDRDSLYDTAMQLINTQPRAGQQEGKLGPDLSYYLANADHKFNPVETAYQLLSANK